MPRHAPKSGPSRRYEWFKTRHVPHMPSRVVFPGMQFSVGARRLKEHRGTPFSMKQLLEANFDIRVGNATRPFYLIGGWCVQLTECFPEYVSRCMRDRTEVARVSRRSHARMIVRQVRGGGRHGGPDGRRLARGGTPRAPGVGTPALRAPPSRGAARCGLDRCALRRPRLESTHDAGVGRSLSGWERGSRAQESDSRGKSGGGRRASLCCLP
jgi:hypothetical protein